LIWFDLIFVNFFCNKLAHAEISVASRRFVRYGIGRFRQRGNELRK
jgi:hypothetical protein